jgi:hypothetical protein
MKAGVEVDEEEAEGETWRIFVCRSLGTEERIAACNVS